MPCNTSETSSASSDSSSSRSQTSIPPNTSSSSSRSGDETGSSSSSTTASSSSGSESSSSSSSVTYPTPPPPGCPDGQCDCKCKCCDEKKSAPACPIEVTPDPVRYFNGEIRLSFEDLDSAGFGLPWGQTRSYTNQLPTDYEFGNGMNWINRQRPVLGEADGGNIFVVLGFRDVRFFAPAGGDTYTPMYGLCDTLLYDSGTDIFTYITVAGEMWVFNGLETPGRPRPTGAVCHCWWSAHFPHIYRQTAHRGLSHIWRWQYPKVRLLVHPQRPAQPRPTGKHLSAERRFAESRG